MTTPAFQALQTLLTDRFHTAEEIRTSHGRDPSWHHPALPDAVCYPQTTEEVSQIVKICAENQIPIIPFGIGSSIEGNVIPTQGGICVDLSQMNKIVRVNADDMDCVVQAGVTRFELNDALALHGLHFPVNPGANATIGGMASTNASGSNAVRYGTMRDNVLALKVVLPDGRIIQTGSRARKSSAGYNLTSLFVGAEGTLGIITEVTLRLHNIPEAISAAVVNFASIDEAVAATIKVIRRGIPIARIELLDEDSMTAVNAYSGLNYPVQPTLFLEFIGTQQAVTEQAQAVGEIMQAHGGGDFQWTTAESERTKLWQARYDAYFAALALRPGCTAITTDVCVPISNLAACIKETQADLAASNLTAPLLGHVGDGNFHIIMLIDLQNEAEVVEAKQLNERLVRRALAMEGTSTGEHGVGMGKREFLREEFGEALTLMYTLKDAIDPAGLMNPGKILPP